MEIKKLIATNHGTFHKWVVPKVRFMVSEDPNNAYGSIVKKLELPKSYIFENNTLTIVSYSFERRTLDINVQSFEEADKLVQEDFAEQVNLAFKMLEGSHKTIDVVKSKVENELLVNTKSKQADYIKKIFDGVDETFKQVDQKFKEVDRMFDNVNRESNSALNYSFPNFNDIFDQPRPKTVYRHTINWTFIITFFMCFVALLVFLTFIW